MDIIDGSTNWGRVAVLHSGVWGTVCARGWADSAADVLCKNMSYAGGVASAGPSKGDMPVWMSFVKCTGTETNLDECTSREFGQLVFRCPDAYVTCYKKGI